MSCQHVYGLETSGVQNCQSCTAVFPESRFIGNFQFPNLLQICRFQHGAARCRAAHVHVGTLCKVMAAAAAQLWQSLLLRAKQATLAKGERPGQTKTNSKHKSSIRDFLKYAITVLYPIRSSWKLTGRWRTPNHIGIWKRNWNFRVFLEDFNGYSCLKVETT